MFEGSLEVKLPTIWTDEKQRWSRRIEKRREEKRREEKRREEKRREEKRREAKRSEEKRREEKRREEERRSEKRKSQKKEDPGARKGRKVAKHCVFPMICGSGGSKSRLAKAAGAEPAGQMRDKKLHAVVAQSRFRNQNVQNAPGPDHFWQLRCRKSARRCGVKHISKSKCTKHTMFGPLLEVALWRDVEKVHAVVARSTFRSQNVKNTTCSRHFWTFRCRFAWQAQGIVLQETCSSELLGGPGADFLRGVAFWSLRSSGLVRWFCVTGAALRMAWHHFFVAGAVL